VIGRTFPLGKGFMGLVRYLESGRSGEEPERVLWSETRNLPTRDLQASARLMAATARESVRTERPVYHLSISFDPSDPVNRQVMRRVADAVLAKLDLSGHQAVIVAHRDTAHPNMHLVVNRVHPERFRAWEKGWDWPKIEAELRDQEVALGLRVVPGWLAPVPGREPARALRRGDAAFLRSVTERAAPVLERAQSWEEVERGLAAAGLSVRIKGGGLSINDGRQEVKASEVGRAFSRKHMEERLGKLSAYRLAVHGEALTPAPAHAVAAPELAQQPPSPATPRQMQPPPSPVRQDERRPPRATPARTPARRAVPLSRSDGHLSRGSHPMDAVVPPEVQHAAALILRAVDVEREVAVLHAVLTDKDTAANELEELRELGTLAANAAADLRAKLSRIYTGDDPTRWKAAERIDRYEREHGREATERVLAKKPEAFGELRKEGVIWPTHRARVEARELLPLIEQAFAAERACPTPAQMETARTTATEASLTASEAARRKDALPFSEDLEQRAAEVLAPLIVERDADWVTLQLVRALPPRDRYAALTAEHVVRLAEKALTRQRGVGLNL
jgi:relaxase-like protein/DNA relaxase TraI-like protein